jgi:hypothetical protein
MERVHFNDMPFQKRCQTLVLHGQYLTSVKSKYRVNHLYSLGSAIIIAEWSPVTRELEDVFCPTYAELDKYIEPVKIKPWS